MANIGRQERNPEHLGTTPARRKMRATKRRTSRWSKTVVGLCATATYLAAVATYMMIYQRDVSSMPPPDLAEFLAGTFSPLAFFWLVLGFFQQGEELRNTAGALWLQGEELRHSVQQQRRLVCAQEAQLTFDRDVLEFDRAETRRQAKPAFIFTHAGPVPEGNSAFTHARLLNRGATCTDFRMQIGAATVNRPLFEAGEGHEILVDIPHEPLSGRGEYTASFVDALGSIGEQKIQVPRSMDQ
jgi:hypothetical protein